MSEETIYLLEVTCNTGLGTEVLRYCTGTGYMSKPTDIPPNAWYEPRIEQPGLLDQNMFAEGTTSGASTFSRGEIVLKNTDSKLDALIDYAFDGYPTVVKQGTQSKALSEFAIVSTVTIEQALPDWGAVTLKPKDRAIEFDVPVQINHYLGNNVFPGGTEGGLELKDKPKRRRLGICRNVSLDFVNTSLLIYQANDGAVNDIPAVYDSGVSLIRGVNYIDQADMEANAPAAGEYRAWLAGGFIRLGSPAGQVTADTIQGASAADRTAGQLIKLLAIEIVGAGSIVEQSIIDLDKSAPYVVGLSTDDANMTYAQALDILCASVGAWWGFDNLGNFWVKQLAAPDALQAIMTLTVDEDITVERLATADGDKGIPVWKVNVDFCKNWTVQTSGLAGQVADNQLTFAPDTLPPLTADRRALLAVEYLRTKAEDTTVKAFHRLAPLITIKTTLDTQADADAIADHELTMRKVRRDRMKVKASMKAIQYPAGGYWDDTAISEMPVNRADFGSAIHNNYWYVVGGYGGGSAYYTSIIRLNLSNPCTPWEQNVVAPLPVGRRAHCCVVYGNYLYVIGGYLYGITAQTPSIIRIDLTSPTVATDPWDDVGVTDLIEGISYFGAVINSNFLYVAGGLLYGGSGSSHVRRLNMDVPTGNWDDIGISDLQYGTAYCNLEVCNGFLYLIAGFDSMGTVGPVKRLSLSSLTSGWDSDGGIANLPYNVNWASTASIGSKLYIFGGNGSGNNRLSTCLSFDTTSANNTWIPCRDLPGALYLSRAVVFMKSIYFVGGLSSTYQSNTWRFRTNDNSEDVSQLTSLGRTILLKFDRYGYTAGRPMLIIGSTADHANRMITLQVWG